MTRAGPHSGLVVLVPAVEFAVARHRERLDVNARLGVPAHITVLFPFMAPARIDDAVLIRLATLFAAAPGFEARLDRTGWFGQDAVWIGPADPQPFRDLTMRVVGAFPEYPPYEGAFPELVPHLTIGHRCAPDDLRAAERDVRRHLPIDKSVEAVTLLVQESAAGRWTPRASFPLAAPPAG